MRQETAARETAVWQTQLGRVGYYRVKAAYTVTRSILKCDNPLPSGVW